MRKKLFRKNWWIRWNPLVFAAAVVAGCESDGEDVVSLRPGWTASQEFHLETRYNKVQLKHSAGDLAADPATTDFDGLDTADLDDTWSEPVYWRYQVIEQGFNPSEGDDLYEYAIKGGTTSALTVIKASLDPALNVGHELIETDPKVYLVIREDRLRLAGMVSFYTLNGVRYSEPMTIGDEQINRSYNLLSQSNLSIVPHFIPPFPIARMDTDLVLEDGQPVSFTNATETSVDVVYTNAIDGGAIAETWEDGQPWATWSVTENVESRLLSADELADLQGPFGSDFGSASDNDDATYVDLLKEPLDLDAALNVQNLAGTKTVPAGRKPWAGSWWRQSEAALVFGPNAPTANTVDTISKIRKQQFQTTATELQTLGDELRTLRRNNQGSSAEYNTKVEQYRAKQNTLTQEMSTFYNAVRSAIDAGRININNGRISAAVNWNNNSASQYPAFDLALNDLSPMDKFALLQQKEGHTYGTNPWFIGAWELLNHWSPAGSSWFGHCNGWAAAAILTNEPRQAKTVAFGPSDQWSMALSVADQKGLLSETNYSTLSNFFGARYNGDPGDDLADLTPKAVLQVLSTYIGERGVPLVFDTTAGDEVWNFPAWGYTVTLTQTSGGSGSASASGLININTAGKAELMTLWGISSVRADRVIAYRQANGAFQTTQDITKVRGIGLGLYNRIKDKITVSASTDLATYSGSMQVQFSTDGVGYSHVDSNPEQPQGFTETWAFTLQTSPSGEIINSTWSDNNKHPDFAWVPYANTANSGSSENGYLMWLNLRDYLGTGVVR